VNQNTKPSTTRIRSDPARWQRLKEILADALEQTSSEKRTAVLRELCADDTTLFREAEKLLAHDTKAFEEFAEFAGTHLRHDERHRIGERMGAYAVVEELGRGGMGAVYLAERADGQFEKRVAIKVLKRGTDTDEVLRRFRIERQILANLEHPNITRLLDGGTTEDGLPYFVMEFIEGTPITKFVQREKIDVRGRLKLFLKVCSAVDLAHRHQIIHRDIKPGNVVVNEDGEPKLLDFGIAKLLSVDSDDGITTVAVERRLTPMYAAPEQNEGQSATIATDVYSLGALLYELLTDHSPCISSNGNLSQGDLSRHPTEPRLPGRRANDSHTKCQLPGQLDRIVARAMRRDPAQRYPSVGALSDDVERYLDGAAPRSEHFSTSPADAKSRRPMLNGRPNSRHHWYIAGAGLSAIVLAAILFFSTRTKLPWLNTVRTATTPAGANSVRLAAVRSIAVLPFEPLGQDMNNELLGLGMADAVIGRMSNLKQLIVLPTSAVSRYKRPATDALVAGRTLGVDAILSGTVQRSGDRVRTTVQLVHVASGRTVWSEKFDQTFTDIFDVQDTISDNVARSLVLNLTSGEQKQLAKRYTTNADAYGEYLMGLYFWNKRSKDGLEKALDHFGRAVEKDPNFALAYALMADCYYLQYNYRYGSGSQWLQHAKAAVDRALLLDDSIAEAHVAAAMIEFYQQDSKVAIASLRRALALNPNLAVAHLRYGWELSSSGHLDEAVREIKRAQELDPLSPTNNTTLGLILGLARQFRGCLEYCYKAAELAPNEASFQENLAYAYLLNGRYQEAIEHYQRVAVLNPDKQGDVLASVATALFSMGRNSEAESMMPEILRLATIDKVNPYYIVALYVARGDKDAAFDWFEKGLGRASDVRMKELQSGMIRYESMLDPLRSDSRFAALLRQYNRGSLLETSAKR
jgi:serine/threonine protein kinase/tetratricopeptide (TPR) repeat protein